MSIALYDNAESPIGKTILRYGDSAVPNQFRPTIIITTNESRQGANINYKVLVDYPLAKQVDGIWVVKNRFQARFSFTALQNEIEDDARALVLDTLISLLQSQKDHILVGNATYKNP